MFKEVPSQFDFPAEEKRILKFWEENKIYEKSLQQREGGKSFVFFEGPPTANGMPHPGHALTRAMKDLFPRYRTMTGHYCLRKGGWDTHGLPVEVEVCKELGIHTKEEIEAYGVEKFNRKCLESVFRYTKEWEEMTKRLGFWVNLEEAYVTYHQPFVESVWWSLKQLFDAGLLYQGYKIVWWWAQGGTALSSGEVGQGYREVDDPSVFVRFPLVIDDAARAKLAPKEPPASAGAAAGSGVPAGLKPGAPWVSLLVWTTTPWTLPSNMFSAVHPDIDYAVVHDSKTDERLIMASALMETIRKKAKGESWTVETNVKGRELIGLRYMPPFDCYHNQLGAKTTKRGNEAIPVAWRVTAADFVTIDSGSGAVHEAPAFGEVDFDLLQKERKSVANPDDIPLLNAVAPNGKFTDEAPAYCRGRWVKECDKDIIRDLKEREAYPGSKIPILLHQEQYRHDYPFCWRAEQDPLIQYPRRSWFIKTTLFRDEMLDNNNHINWLPEHIKEGRFGKFLESNVDWSLSRERYWGTPLPIWVCQSCGQMEAVDSYAALKEKTGVSGFEVWEKAKAAEPSLSDHLRIHKPYIDAIQYDCPKCSGKADARMKRVPEVIDCWYDSGAMPFAQWGYPHTEASRRNLSAQYPADFISEALDQTRGWFYSLVAIATMLFGKQGVARTAIVSGIAHTGEHGPPARAPSFSAQGQGVLRKPVTGEMLKRRRILPHWEEGGSTYFLTFRTNQGELTDDERDIVLQACLHWDMQRMEVHAVVVMPDHVHLLCTPLEKEPSRWWSIADLMHSIKTHTSQEINRFQGTTGHVWQQEYYDRIIRSASDFEEKWNYVVTNPQRRGLPEDYAWVWVEHEREKAPLLSKEESAHGPEAHAPRAETARSTDVTSTYPLPFRNCIVLGLLLGEDGLKMSKSKKNYKEPTYIFDKEGADAMRWLFFSGQAPWTSIRFQESAIAEGQREFLIRLFNVYSFFVIYANIDKWTPGEKGTRSELDRWITSELHRTIRDVRAAMDAYDNFTAAKALITFVDALSNWYVRRGRDRYWRTGMDADKVAAYQTLWEVLVATTTMIAPFTPFFAESLYQNLLRTNDASSPPSVHLRDYPTADEKLIDETLSAEMAVVRDIVSLGRAARADAKMKVRQPLALAEIVLADKSHTQWLKGHEPLIRDEINVKRVEFSSEADHYVNYQVKPNFKSIGPKFGKLGNAIKGALAGAKEPAAMRKSLDETGRVSLTVDGQTVELTPDDVQIELTAKPGWAAAQGRSAVVVLKTEITEELRDEGVAREIIHHIQQKRKDLDLKYEQRIDLGVVGDSDIERVVKRSAEYIMSETLAQSLLSQPLPGIDPVKADIDGHEAAVYVKPV